MDLQYIKEVMVTEDMADMVMAGMVIEDTDTDTDTKEEIEVMNID